MRILVDMDGTIADWGKAWDAELDHNYTGSETINIPRHKDQKSFDLHAGLNADEIAIVEETMNEMNYFDLEPIPGAIVALEQMIADGHDVRIVTSPWLTNENCIADKFKWVEAYLGTDWLERVIVTKDKTHISADYLIDDKPEVKGSATPTWEHVMFDQPYNRGVDKDRIMDWNEDFQSWYKDACYEPSPFNLSMAEPVLVSGEVRQTSSSGGQKGSKPQDYSLIPIEPLALLAELYHNGAAKYSSHNWRKGYPWSLSYSAAMRHMTQFWNGEDLDEEMKLPHVISAAFHMFALAQYMIDRPEFDDRYKEEVADV